jgi:ferritin-like metal-binding protein YciE
MQNAQAMEGLIPQGHKTIRNSNADLCRDSALNHWIPKIEHYEIASYGFLCELADLREQEQSPLVVVVLIENSLEKSGLFCFNLKQSDNLNIDILI